MLSSVARQQLHAFVVQQYFRDVHGLIADLGAAGLGMHALGNLPVGGNTNDLAWGVVSLIEQHGRAVLEAFVQVLWQKHPGHPDALEEIEILTGLAVPDQVFLPASIVQALKNRVVAAELTNGQRYAAQQQDACVPRWVRQQVPDHDRGSEAGRKAYVWGVLVVLNRQTRDPRGPDALRTWLRWVNAQLTGGEPVVGSALAVVSGTTTVALPADLGPLHQQLSLFGGVANLDWWLSALEARRKAVCRLSVVREGASHSGTGFLVGDDLVMTNHHVVAGVGLESPGAITVELDAFGPGPGRAVPLAATWLVDHSPVHPSEAHGRHPEADPTSAFLDWALLRLAAPPDRAPIRLPAVSRELPMGLGMAIVQHPGGREMALATHPEAVIAVNGPRTRVRYRVDAEGGSSGAPVFDLKTLQLVALHHGEGRVSEGRTPLLFNRGIPIAAIVTDMRARLPGPTLAQLGLT